MAASGGVNVPLGGEWDFAYTVASASDVPEIPPSEAFGAKMPVPGRWDEQLEGLKNAKWWPHAKFVTTQGPVRHLSGVGWYRRKVDARADWANRSVIRESSDWSKVHRRD